MYLHKLVKPEGTKNRKRIGRGNASGWGKTAAKGNKGQKSRSGGGVRRGFEGGTMPLNRRLPKRGFNNQKFADKKAEINVRYLSSFESGAVIGPEEFKKAGLCAPDVIKIKIIGNAELEHSYAVKAHGFTKGAKASIEKANGTIEEIRLDK